MSFPRQEDIFGVIENVMVRACAVAGVKAEAPFPHMLYKDSFENMAATSRTYASHGAAMKHPMLPARSKAKLQIEERFRVRGAWRGPAIPGRQLDDLTEKAKSLKARGAIFVKRLRLKGLTSTSRN